MQGRRIQASSTTPEVNAGQALLVLAVSLLRPSGTKLRHSTVQDWIRQNSNPDDFGRGYAGGRLRQGPSQAFIEVTRTAQGSKFNVRASIYLGPRAPAAATKEWTGVTLDSGLEKFFGKNNRVRIDV